MAQEKKGEKKAEMQALPEAEWERRVQEEARTRPERLAKLDEYIKTLFPGKRKGKLRTQIREGFNAPQWGDYHNEGLFLDTHLALILEKIEAICGDDEHSSEALAGVEEKIAVRIRRALQKDPVNARRYALLHDIEKRNTLGFNTLDEKGKRQSHEMPWKKWQKHLGEHPDPVAVRNSFLAFQMKSVSYQTHGEKGAGIADQYGIDPRIVKGIDFHELGFQENVSTKKIREHGVVNEEDIDFIVAVNFLDQSASWRKDGKGDTKAMQRIERILHNIGIIQMINEMHTQVDLSGYDTEDLLKAIQGLDSRSDKEERFESAHTEWKRLLEASRLKHVDYERFKEAFIEGFKKRNMPVDSELIEACVQALSSPDRRLQPKKVVQRIVFERITDKKQALAVKNILEEVLLEKTRS